MIALFLKAVFILSMLSIGVVHSVSFKYSKVETFVINDEEEVNRDVVPLLSDVADNPKEMPTSLLSLLQSKLPRQWINKDYKVNQKGVHHILTDDFKWKSCGPADQLVDIRNLTILPSPLYFPGPLSFGFDILFHDSVEEDASVSATIKLQFNTGGSTWITIPCIQGIGSCTYDNFCSLTEAIPCPEELKQKGIPCTCPFNKGEYKLDIFEVDVDAAVFPSGNYQAQVTITDSNKGQIACYVVTFTVG
ncbi:ganglioside GM2 activator [Biomphalaria glabrata]